ncbi:heparinase II/III domain-containing protein [Paludibacter jiangxiensis]|uniref:Heparinase II/III-like protein n=1 Tax=Paludibacter jiangxiensis TaxID=681398 RepID=A0A161LG40_9BACT|nr:heparinase II/III family protein [Paludibacter jiangxiensis]GAT64305.1 heparinase II/III-like protein [Paludibacter jiangxiensis]
MKLRDRLFFLLVFFSLTFATAFAQISHRNILVPFETGINTQLIPVDEWKPFPQNAAEWRNLIPSETQKNLIKKGEAALKKEFRAIPATVTLEFKRNGNRTDYEDISFDKRYMLWDMVLAEAIEGNGRFTDHIIDGIWSVCEESFWGINAHIGMQKAGTGLPDVQEPVVDLFAAETAAILSWTDYLLGPSLDRQSKLIRQRIRYEIDRRVLTPMISARYGYLGGGNPEEKLSNWAPWVASNYLTANLLLEKDPQRRVDGVTRSMKIINQYINGLGNDGSTEEGPHYWFASGACVFDALALLKDATGGSLDLFQNEFIKQIGAYICKMHIAGNYFINVADAAPALKADGLLLYRFGTATGDDYLKSFGAMAYRESLHDTLPHEQFYRTRQLYNLKAISDCEKFTGSVNDIPDVWLPDVQLMSSRSAKGLFVAAHGGDNGESHNHNDVGDFMVYAGGYPLIIDVGRGTYTARTFSKNRYDIWFNTSAYHNLPLINGYQQAEGREFAASGVKYNHKGNISQLTLDIAKAYPREAGIQSWTRTVEMNKKQGITIRDSYRASAPLKSLSQTFMTICETDLSTPGQIRFILPDKKIATLSFNAAIWKASIEKAQKGIPEEKGLAASWDGKSIYRIILTAIAPNTQGTLQYKITF